MFTRSALHPMPEYFDRYINKCDDVSITDAIQRSIEEVANFPIALWHKLGDLVYAPGKWTVKDMLQHLIDTERVFMFRALATARRDKQSMLSMEEDDYAREAQAGHRSIESLVDELRASHESAKRMFESFTPEMLSLNCNGFKGQYSVASMGFILPGHQRWHMEVLAERYYPLISSE
ncbi:MAG: DinB family protein [Sphingobacteriales bacterium]|nr:MAG: DinB family protein [Sphingobacteriales bacterium]